MPTSMKSAARDLGLDGVTTNPSIIAKAGADFHERMAAICELCEGPVSAEVTATEHDAMLEEPNLFSRSVSRS